MMTGNPENILQMQADLAEANILMEDLQARLKVNREALAICQSQLHTCPTCGANCKECPCTDQKIAALENRNGELRDQVGRLAGALVGATVDYDNQPYQMGDDSIDRLVTGWTSGTYVLDAQAVDDIAGSPWWEEAVDWHGLVDEIERLKARIAELEAANEPNSKDAGGAEG